MDSRIIVALDFAEGESAQALVNRLSPEFCKLKVGKELFTAEGPAFVEGLVQRGFDVFLDLKFHDIPTTVGRACAVAARLGVWMLNVHALGGSAMVRAARDALGAADRPLLIAVTVLTSMSDNDLHEVGIHASAADTAFQLAGLARDNGADGVVCSAHEAGAIRERFGAAFLRVTPGIRLADDQTDDQKRIMTPQRAMQSGSSYLVVGRPVTRAADPAAVLRHIALQLKERGEAL